MRRIARLAAVALFACGGGGGGGRAPAPSAPMTAKAPPAPATFAGRAPESTRLLFRIAKAGAFLDHDGSKLARLGLDALAQTCGVDLARDVGDVEGWVTEEGEGRVEIAGAITTENAACLGRALGAPHTKNTKDLRLGVLRVTPRLGGGVVLATAGATEGRGAPNALATRFAALVASAPDAMLALRTDDGVFDVTLRAGDQGVEIIARPGADLAARAARAVTAALDAARTRGATKLASVVVEQRGDALVLRAEPDPDLALDLKKHVIESFKVPAGSMIPTLEVGDHFFVLKDIAGRVPERGEIVVFDDERGSAFVKRVIALPGDKVSAHGDRFTVNGATLDATRVRDVELPSAFDGDAPQKGTIFHETTGARTHEIFVTADGVNTWDIDLTIPPKQVFVMGDNRNNSHDSRAFGPVPVDRIKGRAALIYLSSAPNSHPRWNRLLHLIE